jgi:hypothetical protein
MSWLRVVTYQLPTDDTAAAIDSIKAGTAEVVAILEQQPGFGGAYWAESPEDNTVSAVSHWTDLSAIEAADAALTKIRAMRDASGAAVAVLEVHQVGLFAVPAISMWADEPAEAPGPRHALSRLQGRLRRN